MTKLNLKDKTILYYFFNDFIRFYSKKKKTINRPLKVKIMQTLEFYWYLWISHTYQKYCNC